MCGLLTLGFLYLSEKLLIKSGLWAWSIKLEFRQLRISCQPSFSPPAAAKWGSLCVPSSEAAQTARPHSSPFSPTSLCTCNSTSPAKFVRSQNCGNFRGCSPSRTWRASPVLYATSLLAPPSSLLLPASIIGRPSSEPFTCMSFLTGPFQWWMKLLIHER